MTESLHAPEPANPETEPAIAGDLARRGVLVAPLALIVAGVLEGGDGVASAAFALALVVANFVASAATLAWAARISPGLYLGTALGGYFVRLGVITVAVLLVRDLSWVHLPTVGITLIVLHLGLLAWEMRAISLTLAAPGLKSDRSSPSGVPEGVAS